MKDFLFVLLLVGGAFFLGHVLTLDAKPMNAAKCSCKSDCKCVKCECKDCKCGNCKCGGACKCEAKK